MRRGICIFLAVMVSFCMGIFGSLDATAQRNFQLRYFEESHGLSSNFVEKITQFSDGRLVICSKNGVDLFDGVTFSPLLIDSFPLEYVTSVCVSGKDMYIGQFDGVLKKFDGLGITSFDIGLSEEVKAIFQESDGRLMIFSRSGIIKIIDRKDTLTMRIPADEVLINQVEKIADGQYAVGTNEGLWSAQMIKSTRSMLFERVKGLAHARISALGLDTVNGVLWIGAEDMGLLHVSDLREQTWSWKVILKPDRSPFNQVQRIFVDASGMLWVSIVDEGVLGIDMCKGGNAACIVQSFAAAVMMQHQVRNIYEDDENNIWVATFGGGLVQIVEKVFEQPFDEAWLRQQSITCLFKGSKGEIWLGIDKGIFRTEPNGSNGQYTYHHIGGNKVTSITENSAGEIWVGTTSNGIYRKAASRDGFVKLEMPTGNLANSINSISCYGKLMYVCTKGGLFVLNQGKIIDHITTEKGLPHNNVKFALNDQYGNTWIANEGNRVSYYRDGEVFFPETSSAQNITDVHHLLKDRSGRLWFSTLGSGIFVLDKQSVTNLTEANGLPSAYCYLMVEDNEGNVWASHQKSLTQITPDLQVSRIIGHQDISPVSNTMITYLFKDDEGSIWVTSTHGVVRYNPSIDKASRTVPRLSISGMRVFDKPMQLEDNMVLPYNKYSISFQLSGISLRSPEAIRYRYQLLGFSDQWSEEFATNVVHFPRLEDGEYTLNVIASKNGGEWNTVPASFSFTIARPFVRTVPFYVMSVVILIAAIGGFVRYRTVKLMSDKLELESQVNQRTLEIQQQKEEIEMSRDEIARYAKDITDSIKYAQRIQSAIFPEWNKTTAILPNSFVFFRSKDIVSGDFFFAEQAGDCSIFAAVDCTGHGVPGGFMSIVANNLLQQAVKQMGLTKPSEILDFLNEGVTNTLHQTYEESSVKDGMDISLCTLNKREGTMQFAGAYNSLYLFRDGALHIYKGDRFPVGMFVGEERRAFSNIELKIQTGDMYYLFSDGYADQFGGPFGKKLKLHGFRAILEEIHQEPIDRQKELLALKLEQWQGNLDQVDDIVVMGVQIS
jgi:ligand-binding sensor domain-containing protein/serine phosphatase RsbU (regulator of sigma subunit)